MKSSNQTDGWQPSCLGRRKKRLSLAGALALGALVLSLATPAFSQIRSGAFVGSAVDPSGAVIPKATVQVISQGTGQTVTRSSLGAGGRVCSLGEI